MQTPATAPQPATIFWLTTRRDVVVLALTAILSVFSAALLARGACSGQNDGLAPGVLQAFPCNGSAAERALFLLTRFPLVILDMLQIRGEHGYFALGMASLLLRAASYFALPRHVYLSVAAPLCNYVARASPFFTWCLAGPRGAGALSVTSSFILFRFNAVGDAFLALTIESLNVPVEAAFNILTLAAVALLTSWHGHHHRDLGAWLPQQLLQRLASIAVIHTLSRYRMACTAGGSRARPGPAETAGASGGGRGRGKCGGGSPSGASGGGSAGSDTGKDGGSCAAVGAPGGAPESAPVREAGLAAAIQAAKAGISTGSSHRTALGYSRLPGYLPGSVSDAAVQEDGKATAAAAHATSTATAPGDAAGKSADAVAEPATEAHVRHRYRAMAGPLPPYRSAVTRRTTRIKIPYAEPEQLSPGFAERLQALAAEQGVLLTGVYVRAGCIELLLDTETWGSGGDTSSSRCSSSSSSGHVSGRGSDSGSSSGRGSGAWDLDVLVEALQLTPLPDQQQQQQQVSQETQQPQLRGHAAAGAPDAQQRQQSERSVKLLEPRVLLLLGASGDGPGAEAEAAPVTLRARVRRPRADPAAAGGSLSAAEALPRLGGEAGEEEEGREGRGPEVLVRSHGRYLTTRVTWVARGGGGDGGGGGDADADVAERGRRRRPARGQGQPERRPPSQQHGQAGRVTLEPRHGAFVEVERPQQGSEEGGLEEEDVEVEVEVELLGPLPHKAGVLLVECRWGGRLSRAVPVLLLDDPALLPEMQAAVAGLYDRPDELDELLQDMGNWLWHVPLPPPPPPSPATSATCGAAATPAPAGAVAAATTTPVLLLPAAVASLGRQLLCYATECGWAATAARVRDGVAFASQAGVLELRELAEEPQKEAAVAAAAAGARQDSASAVDAAAPAATARTEAVPAAAALAAVAALARGVAESCPRGPGPAAAPWRRRVRSSLARAVGLERAGDAAEEAAFEAYAAPLVLVYGHAIQALEAVALLALLFRARRDLLCRGNLTTLAGCCVGTLTTLAWPLLPRSAWVRLVNATKIPRYLCYMLAKVLIGFFGFPAPPGIVAYQLGAAMLVMEGLVLPGSCLLPTRTALLITLAKWPLGVAMMLGSGATDSVLQAVWVCGRIVVLAVLTTVACQTHLRYSFASRMEERGAAVAAAAAAGAGVVFKGVRVKAKGE